MSLFIVQCILTCFTGVGGFAASLARVFNKVSIYDKVVGILLAVFRHVECNETSQSL